MRTLRTLVIALAVAFFAKAAVSVAGAQDSGDGYTMITLGAEVEASDGDGQSCAAGTLVPMDGTLSDGLPDMLDYATGCGATLASGEVSVSPALDLGASIVFAEATYGESYDSLAGIGQLPAAGTGLSLDEVCSGGLPDMLDYATGCGTETLIGGVDTGPLDGTAQGCAVAGLGPLSGAGTVLPVAGMTLSAGIIPYLNNVTTATAQTMPMPAEVQGVPEPSVPALGCLAVGLLAAARRRRPVNELAVTR